MQRWSKSTLERKVQDGKVEVLGMDTETVHITVVKIKRLSSGKEALVELIEKPEENIVDNFNH